MWLSEKTAGPERPGGTAARLGTVTIGGASASVLVSGEARELGLLAPGGVGWQPRSGQEVMVLETEDGERFILGVVCDSTGMQDGQLHLNGDVHIDGRLFLNGVELTPGSGLGV